MAAPVLGFVLVPALLALVIVGVKWLLALTRARGAARRALARSIAASAAALVGGLGAFALWAFVGGEEVQDRRLATAPLFAAAVAVLVAAVAELTWPRPLGTVRSASLGARRPNGPDGLRWLTWLGLGTTLAALLVGAVTAAPDGQSVARAAAGVRAVTGPYPGLAYAVPVAISAAVLVVALLWALRRIEARPALGAGHEELDVAVRQASLVRVLRPAAAGSLLTAAALWLTIGAKTNAVTQNLRMHAPQTAPHSPGDWIQNLGFLATGLGLVLFAAGMVALRWKGPVLPSSSGAVAAREAA